MLLVFIVEVRLVKEGKENEERELQDPTIKVSAVRSAGNDIVVSAVSAEMSIKDADVKAGKERDVSNPELPIEIAPDVKTGRSTEVSL